MENSRRVYPPAVLAHTLQLALAQAQLLDDSAGKFVRYVDDKPAPWAPALRLRSSYLVDDLCLADSELIALTAHRLNQNGQMQLAAAGYLERIGIFCVFDTQADVSVQLAEQTVTQMTGGNEFTFLTCQRAVIDDEIHGNRRLGDLLERNRLRAVHRTDRISDMQICDTGNRYDRTDR